MSEGQERRMLIYDKEDCNKYENQDEEKEDKDGEENYSEEVAVKDENENHGM